MKTLIAQSRIISRCLLVGLYFTQKYRAQALSGSTLKAAKNLRKQGVSIETALLMLAYRVQS